MNKAFTLIELLVVMAIVSIFAGVGIVSFQSFGRSSLLESRTKDFVSAIESAKVEARSGEKGGCTVLNGYNLVIDSPTTYRKVPDCISGTGTSVSYSIPDGEDVEISGYTTQTTQFDRLGTKITANCFILEDVRTNTCMQVTISAGGATSITKNVCSCN